MSATRHLTFRVQPDDLERIDHLAATHHLSRSQYVVSVATGQMPAQRSEAMQRIEELEDRVSRLDRAVFEANQSGW